MKFRLVSGCFSFSLFSFFSFSANKASVRERIGVSGGQILVEMLYDPQQVCVSVARGVWFRV